MAAGATHLPKAAMEALSTSTPKGSATSCGISVQRFQCFKTKRCRFWLEGRCTRGDRCTYAHTDGELRVPPDLTKTKICTRWKRGACENSAENCAYAHGMDELRTPSAAAGDSTATSTLPNGAPSSTDIPTKLSLRTNTMTGNGFCPSKGFINCSPLTNRSTATVTSTVSTMCSTFRGLDSSDRLPSSSREGLYDHGQKGSSETLFSGEGDDASSDSAYAVSCTSASRPSLLSPIETPIPCLRRRPSTGSLREIAFESEQFVLATPAPITAAVIVGNCNCAETPSPRSLNPITPPSYVAFDNANFEDDGGFRETVWQALLRSMLETYCD